MPWIKHDHELHKNTKPIKHCPYSTRKGNQQTYLTNTWLNDFRPKLTKTTNDLLINYELKQGRRIEKGTRTKVQKYLRVESKTKLTKEANDQDYFELNGNWG